MFKCSLCNKKATYTHFASACSMHRQVKAFKKLNTQLIKLSNKKYKVIHALNEQFEEIKDLLISNAKTEGNK